MPVFASEIANFLGIALLGPDVEVTHPAPAQKAGPGAILFLKNYDDAWLNSLDKKSDVCVIAPAEYKGKLMGAFIESTAPRFDFARVVTRFFLPVEEPSIATTARIHPKAVLGANITIGDYCIVGENASIGDGSILRNHVVISKNCRIGKNCLVKSSTVVGEEGFGFEFEADGTPMRIPHLGGVRIGDNVEIGALNVIARGTLGDTVLENNVKTDDHVFIAHNVSVGENTVIIACSEISGSVNIGKNVWIAPSVCIINQAVIGDRALVGMGAVVTKSVEGGMIVAGNPAKVLKPRP